VLSTTSICSTPLYLCAVHRQYSFSSVVPRCCPPLVFAPLLCTSVLLSVFAQFLVSRCCPPSVSVLFRFTWMLSTVNVRSVPFCLSAVHRPYPLSSFVPQCCPPSVSVQFLCASMLSPVSTIRSVPFYLGAVHRQCPFSSFVPRCCPPSVFAAFLCASMLSTVIIRSVPLYLGTVHHQYSLSSFAPRHSLSSALAVLDARCPWLVHLSPLSVYTASTPFSRRPNSWEYPSSIRLSTVTEQVRIETKT
jgi:hypothetical protein